MSCSEQTGSGESSDHQLVVDSWEEAGDEAVEERQKQLLKKKHKEEEMRALREQAAAAQQNQITTVGDRQSGIKILRRPQSCGTLPSPSTRPEVPKTDETQQQQLQTQAKLKSLEERQAAYQQARERIFGKFNPDEEVET
ncbi:unnamed protein product, partial [Anisakis simplex]|uniref:SUZ domain-containing protein n=1 Tax=Anisakis simplex TaxID=6269 RepID=A0A0M3J8W7_ANISI